MAVLGDGPGRGVAALGARDDDRDLAGERHELLDDAGHAAHRGPRRRDVVARRDADLALAVVAQARALDDPGTERGIDASRVVFASRSTA